MIDEMTNTAIINYVQGDEDATETERELAERLSYAIEELDRVCEELARYEIEKELNGSTNSRGPGESEDQGLATS